ncbi:MAG: hydroxyacid dehydrogenase [Proteobacteria bacterium]|nr:MAG: hydroxyacid dehydrogenase [Pseudomonadota bacterium]
MKIVLLDKDTLGDDVSLDVFSEFGEFVSYPKTSAQQTLERIKEAKIIITNKVVIDKNILDHATNLKLICIAATGMNNVDLEYAKKKNVSVKNVAGYSTQGVAQYTLMQALSLLGKNAYYDDYVKSGQWAKSEIFVHLGHPFHDIEGKKWGIIGLGSIGKKVAKLASAFDADVCYYSTSGKNTNQTYKQVSLDEMLSSCDIISIHAPLNEQTNNLLDAKELAKMKQDAILINVARGGIVNEKALVEAVNNNKIYACIDVLTREPMEKNSPYLNVKNKERILFSPHIAWASVEARKRLIKGIVENIKTFLKDK